MKITIKRSALVLALVGTAAIGGVAGFIWSGRYNVSADSAHTAPVLSFLHTVRERSIAYRAAGVSVPNLSDPERVRKGAGNYAAMCAACHLAPGMAPTELSKGLYPAPPTLASMTPNPARQFWVTKHGIKASGMPAWGRSMEDAYIWDMVAFLQRLPELDEHQYADLVASSDGHSHGGGETHSHADPQPSTGHAASRSAEGATHVHADGETHVHADAPATTSIRTPAPRTAKSAVPTQAPAPTPTKLAPVDGGSSPRSSEPQTDHDGHDHHQNKGEHHEHR